MSQKEQNPISYTKRLHDKVILVTGGASGSHPSVSLIYLHLIPQLYLTSCISHPSALSSFICISISFLSFISSSLSHLSFISSIFHPLSHLIPRLISSFIFDLSSIQFSLSLVSLLSHNSNPLSIFFGLLVFLLF